MSSANVRPSVLYELFNLTIPAGTGIATYARNLCATAAGLGYEAQGLFNTNRSIDRKNALLAEIQFFDARNAKRSRFAHYASHALPFLFGAPFGIATAPLPRCGIVLHSKVNHALSPLSQTYVSRIFLDAARYHFGRYRTGARLNLTTPPDIFHATQAIPLRVPGARNVYTIHDIVPLRLPQTTLDDKKYFLEMVRYLGRTADRIVTVSEASRKDLIEFCGIPEEKIVNTYQAVSFPDEVMAQTLDEAARLVKHCFDLDPGGYFLFFGALEPKKNVGRLIDAFVASGTDRKLVIAGGLGWEYDADLEKIESSRSKAMLIEGRRIIPDERILRLQHLPLFQLTALIRCARAVVFPSLYEGFGLPVLESMLLGAPVITSDVSSLPEIAGDAALLVDPTSVGSIVQAIRKLDADDALCADLRGRGRDRAEVFSPDAYRHRVDDLYKELLGSKFKVSPGKL